MGKKWIFKTSGYVTELDKITQSSVLSSLLYNRGITTEQAAKIFLDPISTEISSPFNFVDMKKSVERIKKAIDNSEHITVYGDFDADGITSTSLLYLTLKHIGADVGFYLPDRNTESHGLNTKAVVKLISKDKSKLIITVDCGVGNVSEAALAKTFKTDIIITDHHEAREILPDAFAIINPKAKNSLLPELDFETIDSLNCLAGVGVAFKLACALLEKYEKQDFAKELLPLVAVGTIGDVVPLVKENRCLVTSGLALIKQGTHFGLTKLLNKINLNMEALTSENIAFGIVPRINATGRLDNPAVAIDLLISKDEQTVESCIDKLNKLNEERQYLCDETFEQAVHTITKSPHLFRKSIILFSPYWHIGIIGIVASKLVEKYHLPTFLMTKDSSDENKIRCSCRSIKGINIFETLSVLNDKFLNFGGHKMAAGFAFDSKVFPFEVMRKEINKVIDEQTQGFDFTPTLEIDMPLEAQDLSVSLVDDIEKLQPFGADNQPPVFAMTDLVLKSFKKIGANSNHLKMYLETPLNNIVECVKWNTGNFEAPLNTKLDIAFSPKTNTFNGKTTLQLEVYDIHSEYIKEEKVSPSSLKILDHRKKTDILDKVMDYISTTKLSTSVFAVNKNTISMFDKYEIVKNKICSLPNVPQSDQIMFFDCPEDEEELKELLNLSEAKTIHFMRFNSQNVGVKSLLTTLSGMIKYCVNNKNGEIDISTLTKNLGVGELTTKLSLTLLEQAEMISLESADEINYKINFLKPVKLSEIEEQPLYNELTERITQTNNFKKRIFEATVEELHEICEK